MNKKTSFLYFAYGSNMSTARLRERIPNARLIGVALLKDYVFKCNKASKDGSSKGNITPLKGALTWGVVIEISIDRISILDQAEGGYQRIPVCVSSDNQIIECESYISQKYSAEPPFDWYMNYIIEGAQEHGLPGKYIRMLLKIKVKKVTYKLIQDWVKKKYGFVPQTCWIAHAKELSGFSVRPAPNRKGLERVKPCPADKVEPIQAALRHFGMIWS